MVSQDDRVAMLRGAYESFNRQDLDAVLSILADDVLWPDVVNDVVMQGKQQVREYFERVFSFATMQVTVGDLIPIGEAVLATTYQRFYDLEGKQLGQPRTVVNRYSFRGDLVSRMEVTAHEDIPEEVRRRYREEE